MSSIEAVGTLLGANLGAIIFAAGILYNKVNNVEKKIDKVDQHAERIASHEARITSLENKLRT